MELTTAESVSAGSLYDAALRRLRAKPVHPPIRGGEVARFELDLDGGYVASVSFRAQRCATLLTYCEALAQAAEGKPVTEVAAIGAVVLRALVHGVPANKLDRSDQAVKAWRRSLAELERADESQSERDESRIE